MRKTFALILALVLALAGCVAAFAEGDGWTCPSCGAEATGNFCNNCGGERPDAEETVRLDLEIAFEKNAYFSTYDVKLFVDDRQIAVLEHGIDWAGTLYIASGKHIIRFEEAGSSRGAKGETVISITEPSLYSCGIHAKSSVIKITDERTEAIRADRAAPGRPDTVPVDGETRLQVSVEFRKNGIFSQYYVDLYCDDVLIATLPHGKNYEGTWLVSEGTHMIMFCKSGDRSVRGSVTVKVSRDAAFSCHIEATRNKVEITKDRLTE